MKRDQQEELAALLGRYSGGEGLNDTAIPHLHCFKVAEPSAKMPVVYRPCLSQLRIPQTPPL